MTTSVAVADDAKEAVVEAYRLDRYDNFSQRICNTPGPYRCRSLSFG